MRLSKTIAAVAFSLCAILTFHPAHAETKPVTVFAAASLKNAMDKVGKDYSATKGSQIRFSYAASSALAKQIDQGAPADLFISADTDWMDFVAQHKLIDTATRRDLLTNHLALIAPVSSPIKIEISKAMPLAAALGAGRLAVAGPQVPAGKYARASLTTLGVWSSVEGKLAQADNVRGALILVARGETPLGIVYDTDAASEPKVKIVGLFPDDSHPKIVYPVARIAASANPDTAAFLTYLEGPAAAATFQKYHFSVVDSSK